MIELTNHLDEIAQGIRSLSQSVDQRRLKNARALARAGDYIQACQEIEGHNFSEPRQRVEVMLLLAKVSAQQGMFDKASAYWKQVLRVDSENKEALSGLAAISKQFARPPLQRVWEFLGASVMFIILTSFLVFFIDTRIHDLNSRIVSISTDNRDFTLQQSSQIGQEIKTLRNTYADELAITTNSINSLRQSVLRSEEQALQREQTLKGQVNSAFAKVQKEVALHQKAFDTQLNSLETNSIDRMSTLFQQQEKESTLMQERLGKLELSLTSFGEKIRALNNVLGKRVIEGGNQQKSLKNRLDAMEHQLLAIQERLSERNL